MQRLTNTWSRGKNKRALEKKERAKARHFSSTPVEKTLEVETAGREMGVVSSIEPNSYVIMVREEYWELHRASYPNLVIGDRLIVNIESDHLAVSGLLPRRSFLARLRGDASRRSHAGFEQHVIAANVDRAVIVAAAKNPEFHPRFVDRYLVVCHNGGVEPVIVLNKADLIEAMPSILVYYRDLGIPVVETSVITGQGMEILRGLLKGKTVVLVGNSGVGKSSIINALVPEMDIKVNEVSVRVGKGKHTTTASNLYKWGEASYIIDTPGIRSLGIEDLDKKSLAGFFPEFEEYAGGCKYSDCTHSHEPGCAVKAAVESGQLLAARYNSYLRLLEE